MHVRHEIQIQCKCPTDDLLDLYDCIVECERVLKIEEIISAVEDLAGQKMFQEDLTVKLARQLNARVTTTGWHFGTVKTTVWA